MIVLIALTLSSSNLYGYIRCKMGKSDGLSGSLQSLATNFAQGQAISSVRLTIFRF